MSAMFHAHASVHSFNGDDQDTYTESLLSHETHELPNHIPGSCWIEPTGVL